VRPTVGQRLYAVIERSSHRLLEDQEFPRSIVHPNLRIFSIQLGQNRISKRSGPAAPAGLRQGVRAGLDRRNRPYAAAKLGHLFRISAAHSCLRHPGLPRRRRPGCGRHQYAHSSWNIRDARACGDPAIPSRQYRHLAARRGLPSLVRATTVAAAASAERNARRLAVALCRVHVLAIHLRNADAGTENEVARI
jgi:hypothetical protein